MNKVRIGSIGLGRLGDRHAENIAEKIPNAELIALCDVDADKLKRKAESLRVPHLFTDFDEMLECDDVDAVVIASPSGLHTEQIEKALEKGKHVFSEKPLGITVEQCKKAEEAVVHHPDRVFMLGFMRRFDPSYQYAKQKVDAGEIGKPILFRAYSQDPEKQIAGSIAFAAHSGGAFLDMAVHDIDLARWFLKSEPENVYAVGGCYAHEEFARYGDGDNVSCLMKFQNGAMGFLFAGRTAPHGYHIETEIVGTKGVLRIGSVPQKNIVEILDSHGVRRECCEDFLERFQNAYISEINEFADCILHNRKPEVTVYDGRRVVEIAGSCKQSFETGKLVEMQQE
ncbi:inositol 2-dehydrogenase [Clostridium sp. KNHs216]|uniref:inositol 2-dehydrogenase n=1 Tax=Clostridium sp. KNHs216 TaxID=1550235 RepID=UPI00114D7F89|nr:inositol 2-dehydrogenase [Clostridium sp. KNHs216]